jgi:hypothetical protein
VTTAPAGWERFTFDVHPDDIGAWKRAAADRNVTLREWMRAILNLEAGVPIRVTGRRKRIDGLGPLANVRVSSATQREAASAHVALAAPPCDHVPRGGFCGRCGAVRA